MRLIRATNGIFYNLDLVFKVEINETIENEYDIKKYKHDVDIWVKGECPGIYRNRNEIIKKFGEPPAPIFKKHYLCKLMNNDLFEITEAQFNDLIKSK